MKKKLSIILLSLLLYGVHSGKISRKTEYENADQLDLKMIEETGCKYQYLKENQSVLFTKREVTHTRMAARFLDPAGGADTTFLTHFAVRTAGELHVLMMSGIYDYLNRTEPDYKIGFGVNHNKKSFLSYTAVNYGLPQYSQEYEKSGYNEVRAVNLLSEETYVKLHVKIDNDMRYGVHCSDHPMDIQEDFTILPLEVAKFGFYSRSESAKILYDCPADFGGGPCKK